MADTVSETLSTTEASITNNWPYVGTTGLDPTPGLSPDATFENSFNRKDSFEYIAKNLSSFPYELAADGISKIIIKTYYVSPTKTIIMKTDYSNAGEVVKTISGDTGVSTDLVKTVRYISSGNGKVLLDAVYS